MPGMADQLEQDAQRAVENFVADVESSATRGTPDPSLDLREHTEAPGDVAKDTADHTPPSNRPPR